MVLDSHSTDDGEWKHSAVPSAHNQKKPLLLARQAAPVRSALQWRTQSRHLCSSKSWPGPRQLITEAYGLHCHYFVGVHRLSLWWHRPFCDASWLDYATQTCEVAIQSQQEVPFKTCPQNDRSILLSRTAFVTACTFGDLLEHLGTAITGVHLSPMRYLLAASNRLALHATIVSFGLGPLRSCTWRHPATAQAFLQSGHAPSDF